KSSIPDVPVLVNHSRLDDVVPFEQGRDLASTWCAAGNRVAFEDNLGPTHVGGYVVSLPRVEAFTDRTFAGKAPLDSCWRLRAQPSSTRALRPGSAESPLRRSAVSLHARGPLR